MPSVNRGRARDGATLAAIGLTLVVLGAIGVAAWFLADTQSDQRRDLRERYVERTEVAGSLIDSLFAVAFNSGVEQTVERYGGETVDQAVLDRQVARGQNHYLLVLADDGEVLAASSGTPADVRERLTAVPPHLRTALRAGYALADLPDPEVVETAVAFPGPDGRRMIVTGNRREAFSDFLRGTLRPLPTLDRSASFVIDSRGRSLGGTSGRGGPRAPSDELVREAEQGERGEFTDDGEEMFVASQMLANSPWRVVVTAPNEELYASVSGPGRWLPWVILVAAALALLAVAALIRRLLRATAALDASRVRLEERAEELERSNADLEQFAYAASHDLSEPLRTVAGFSQLLSARYGGQLDSDADEYIRHMTSGVERMQQLIDDLLLYSRVGRAPVRHEAVDLEAVLAEVVEWLGPAISDRDARVTHDPLPRVRGERSQLAQVLQNLIANAIKFTAPGQAPSVHVSAAREPGGTWRVTVRDNGIGIDADPEHIFKMFARLHPAESYPGTGIGLALAKRIIENHGGRIWFEAASGGGTMFSFTLPAAAGVRQEIPA
jgi:signal transduction histidine kinase